MDRMVGEWDDRKMGWWENKLVVGWVGAGKN